jgi:aerotaxis receptor
MPDSNGSLTLGGLAQILRGHMDGTAARFAEVGASLNDLRGEIGRVAALVVQLTQVVAGQVDELAEYRQEILRIYSRMEQQDARIEQQGAEIAELRRDTRRILDAMERRGGDGGPREA